MKKKYVKKSIYLCLLLLVILFEVHYLYSNRYQIENNKQVVKTSDIEMINGYYVLGDNFYTANDDPFFIFNTDMKKIKSVTINLGKNLKRATQIKFYFGTENGFFEDNSKSFKVHGGIISKTFDLNHDNYKQLRLDVDGKFCLDSIEVVGGDEFLDYKWIVKTGIFFGIMDFLFILILFLIKKKAVFSKYFYDKFSIWLEKNITKTFVIIALICGIIYSFIVPISQVPDEATHIKFMCEALGSKQLYNQYREFDERNCLTTDITYENCIVREGLYEEISEEYFNKEKIVIKPQLRIELLRYMPQIIGFIVGYFFDLSIFWCLHLGEFTALLMAVIICWLALKIIPVKKKLLCAIMLLPMNLQQYPSFNYDALMLPLCYLFIAHILYCKYSEKKLVFKNLLCIIGILSLVILIKLPYVLLGFFVLLIPIKKWNLKIGKFDIVQFVIRYRYILGLLCVVAGIGIFVLVKNPYIMYIKACLLNINETFNLYKRTLMLYSGFYITSTIGFFGWLQTPVSTWFVYFVIISLLLFAQEGKPITNIDTCKDKVIYALGSIICVLFIIMSMLTWSFRIFELEPVILKEYVNGIKNLNVILGVQGRYFLPILFPIIMFWDMNLKTKIKDYFVVYWQIPYYIVCISYPIYLLIQRFWIG